MTIANAYLSAAGSAEALLRDPAVGARWAEPSALKYFTVGGLAAHLGRQVLSVPEALAAPVPDGVPIGLLDHYSRSAWANEDLEGEVNVAIRSRGEDSAAEGPEALVANVSAMVEKLRTEFDGGPLPEVVGLPWTGWSLTFDDFLTTRLLELVIHSDDLAVSVGVETPVLPASAIEPVVDLLTRISMQRHGQAAVLRALSRSERAPESVSAF